MSLQHVQPATRTSLEDAIERLLVLLDQMDGDADFEAEESDQNGDEGDYSRCEDDGLASELHGLHFGPLMGGQGL